MNKKINSNKKQISKPYWIVGLILSLASILIFQNAFADTDVLAGTPSSAVSTLNGSGRYWMYLIDGAISLGMFAKTKNPFVFASVLGVALAVTLIVQMVGGA